MSRHDRPLEDRTRVTSNGDEFDDRLVRDPRFLKYIEAARTSLRKGPGVKLESLDE